jgi:hypothetical protein
MKDTGEEKDMGIKYTNGRQIGMEGRATGHGHVRDVGKRKRDTSMKGMGGGK